MVAILLFLALLLCPSIADPPCISCNNAADCFQCVTVVPQGNYKLVTLQVKPNSQCDKKLGWVCCQGTDSATDGNYCIEQKCDDESLGDEDYCEEVKKLVVRVRKDANEVKVCRLLSTTHFFLSSLATMASSEEKARDVLKVNNLAVVHVKFQLQGAEYLVACSTSTLVNVSHVAAAMPIVSLLRILVKKYVEAMAVDYLTFHRSNVTPIVDAVLLRLVATVINAVERAMKILATTKSATKVSVSSN